MERRTKGKLNLKTPRTIPDPTLLLSAEENATVDAAFSAIVEVFRTRGLQPPSRADWRNTRLRNGLIDYVLTVAG